MYVAADDVSILPTAVAITINDTVYHIYFSADKLTCFKGKEEDHLVEHCKNIDPLSQFPSTVEKSNSVNEALTSEAEKK